MTDASVDLWGRRIGAVSWDDAHAVGVFQYDPAFAAAAVELSPIVMPVREAPYVFPALGREAFYGLPGLLADSLPDSFGNVLIDLWLAETGRRAEAFSAVDRLCYMGSRGMGALEFRPALRGTGRRYTTEIAQLVDLANRVLDERPELVGRLGVGDDRSALEDILSVGTSAGGARAKAVLAWNPATGEFRSGQVDTAAGFEHWILKFDGVANNRDRELADPRGFGRIEYAYSQMARAAGIEMAPCRLHHEGDRSHFMTRRFDRDGNGRKVHMQSLGALRHFDYNVAGAHSYEQAVETIRLLGLGMVAVEQQVRRAVFNLVSRNQDDHVKSISFLMDRHGVWRLSPAYDVVYAFNRKGPWTSEHQMSLAGRRSGFERADVLRFAATAGLKARVARNVVAEAVAAVAEWPRFAADAGVPAEDVRRIAGVHRLGLGVG